MRQMGTTQARKTYLIRKMHTNPMNEGNEIEFWAVPPWAEYAYIFPGNRPDPLEESAASMTWREWTLERAETD